MRFHNRHPVSAFTADESASGGEPGGEGGKEGRPILGIPQDRFGSAFGLWDFFLVQIDCEEGEEAARGVVRGEGTVRKAGYTIGSMAMGGEVRWRWRCHRL